MSRFHDEDSCHKLKSACTNIIGFGQLLEAPTHPRISEVNRLQYRAYMIGGALNLADLVIEHHDALADLFPGERVSGLKDLSLEFKNLVVTLDGDHQRELEKQAMEFGFYCLGVFNQ